MTVGGGGGGTTREGTRPRGKLRARSGGEDAGRCQYKGVEEERIFPLGFFGEACALVSPMRLPVHRCVSLSASHSAGAQFESPRYRQPVSSSLGSHTAEKVELDLGFVGADGNSYSSRCLIKDFTVVVHNPAEFRKPRLTF